MQDFYYDSRHDFMPSRSRHLPETWNNRPNYLPDTWHNHDYDLRDRYDPIYEDEFRTNGHRRQLQYQNRRIWYYQQKLFESRVIIFFAAILLILTVALNQCQPKQLINAVPTNIENYEVTNKNVQLRKKTGHKKGVYLQAFNTQKEAFRFMMETEKFDISIMETDDRVWVAYIPVASKKEAKSMIELLKKSDITCTPFEIDV